MGAGGSVGKLGFRADTDFIGIIGVFSNHTIDGPHPDGLIPELGSSLGLLTGMEGKVNAQWQGTKIPTIRVWNFRLRYLLLGDMAVEAAYSANRTTRLNLAEEGGVNLNQLTEGQMAMGSQLPKRVDNPFSGVIAIGLRSRPTVPYGLLLRAYPQYKHSGKMFASGADSIYHSLQCEAQRQFSDGLSLWVAYTSPKLIDTGSRIFAAGPVSDTPNVHYRKADRSDSGNDISQPFLFRY